MHIKKIHFNHLIQISLAVLFVTSCASTPQSDKLLHSLPNTLALQYEMIDVPFHPQQAYQCGPAALATLLQANNTNVTPSDLVRKIYLPERQGTLQIEIVSTTRKYGFIPYRLKPNLEELLIEVNQGRPVLVFQNLGLSISPQWHYAVVIGYDLKKKEIILRSGTNKRLITSIYDFERSWLRAGHWSMIALTPGELPRQPDEWRYVKAIIGFERLKKWQALKKAYLTGLRVWPNSLELNIVMGNFYYQNNNLQLAKEYYSRTLKVNPNYAPAHNNLAQIYYEQGNYSVALQHAKTAIKEGGIHLKQYTATMQLIKQKLY